MKRCMFLIRESMDGPALDACHLLTGDSTEDARVYEALTVRARYGSCRGPFIYDFGDPHDRERINAHIQDMDREELTEFMRDYAVEAVYARLKKGDESKRRIQARKEAARLAELYPAEF